MLQGDCAVAMPDGPRLAVLRHRNRIRVSALTGAIAIALAGCRAEATADPKPQPTQNTVLLFENGWTKLHKFCDGPRAVYVVSTQAAYGAGGMWVIPNANECAASGTSGSAQDRNGLDPKGAGPTSQSEGTPQ